MLGLLPSWPQALRNPGEEVCFGCHLVGTWEQEDPAEKGKQRKLLWCYVGSSCRAFSARLLVPTFCQCWLLPHPQSLWRAPPHARCDKNECCPYSVSSAGRGTVLCLKFASSPFLRSPKLTPLPAPPAWHQGACCVSSWFRARQQ